MALTDSLISYWKLDESSGNAIDSHGSNELVETAGTIAATTGKINGARDFEDGDTEYFTIADNASISTGDIDFTFCCWINAESLAAQGRIIAKINAAVTVLEHQLFYSTVSSRFRFQVFNGTSVVGTADWSAAPSTATWYFIVCWHDAAANTINIQVNDGTPVSNATTGAPADTAAAFSIGSLEGLAGSYWDGLIDEVGFWKRTLTSGERTSLYNGGAGLAYPFTVGNPWNYYQQAA